MRLPKVLDHLASFGAHDRKTWEVFSRVLRDSGDLSRTKRGVGAAHAGITDITTLVLAGMATSSPARAPLAVNQYRTLPLRPLNAAPSAILELSDVFDQPTFGSAFDLLIATGEKVQRAIKRHDEAKVAEFRPSTTYLHEAVLDSSRLRLTLFRPYAGVEILFEEIAEYREGEREGFRFIDLEQSRFRRKRALWRNPRSTEDLPESKGWEESATLSDQAIYSLSKLARDASRQDGARQQGSKAEVSAQSEAAA